MQAPAPRQPDTGAAQIAEAVIDRIGDKVADSRAAGSRAADSRAADSRAADSGTANGGRAAESRIPPTDTPSVPQTIALREQAPEMYELWLKIAKDNAATANYVQRAPYEVPERLAHSGRPRALGALIIVLSFCGYLAWLGGPGPYIGGLIAILDLGVMFGMFFGLRPERLPDPQRPELRPPGSQRRR